MKCRICGYIKAHYFTTVSPYRYYICQKCHTVSIIPSPEKRLIDRLYKNDSYEYRVDKKSTLRITAMAKVIVRTLKKMYPLGKTLLDIGSGFGFFINEADNHGLKSIGIEPARNLYLYSRVHTKAPVLNKLFESYISKNASKKFDFISLIHVIEHVPNPRKTILDLTTHLTDSGILYIETPNIESWLFHFEKKSYTFLTPPDHINLIGKTGFQYIIPHNFEVIYLRTYSYPEHFTGILRLLKARILNAKKRINEPHVKHAEAKTHYKNLKNNLPFFDLFIAPLLTPLLNLFDKGSILQIYIRRKRN